MDFKFRRHVIDTMIKTMEIAVGGESLDLLRLAVRKKY
jgi:hypothetical protein